LITCILPEEIGLAFEIGNFRTFQTSVTLTLTLTLTLDRVIRHIFSCIAYRPLPTNQISFKSEKNLWRDGRMGRRTGGHCDSIHHSFIYL